MHDPIAHRDFDGVAATDERFSLRVQVGRPYQVSAGEWRCPVSLGCLAPDAGDACGADSWQALQLAFSLVHLHLRRFLERGGRLYLGGEGEPSNLDERARFQPGDFPNFLAAPSEDGGGRQA